VKLNLVIVIDTCTLYDIYLHPG